MKKQVFLAITVMALMFSALQASALYSIIYSAPTDSVRGWYLTTRVGAGGITGTYNGHFIYGKVGDTLIAAPTAGYTVGVSVQRLDSLLPNMQYRFAWVVTKSGVSDTSMFQTATTPNVLPISFTNMTSVGGFPSKISFHYNMTGGYHALVKGELNNGVYVTPDMELVGSGDTVISISSPNVAGTTYAFNDLFGTVIGTVPYILTPYTVVSVPDYTVPSLVPPAVAPIAITARGQDSLWFTNAITVGTLGYANIRITLYEGLIPHGNKLMTIYHDTTIVSKYNSSNNLLGNHTYTFSVFASNTVGNDSEIVSVTTRNYPLGSITSWYMHDSTTSSAVINVTATSNGVWYNNTNTTYVVINYSDKNGVSHGLGSPYFQGVQSHDFTLTNLKPGPASNKATIYINTNGGIDSQIIYFTIVTPAPPRIPNAPQWGSLIMVDAATLKVHGLHLNVVPHDTEMVMLAVQNQNTAATDTVYMQWGITSSGTLPDFLIPGLVGGTTYTVTPIAVSADSVYAVGNGVQQYTNSPSNPIVNDIIINSVTNNSVNFNVRVNGEGTPTIMKVKIYDGNGSLVKDFGTISVGTGYIDYQFSTSNLVPNNNYTIDVTVTDNMGTNAVEAYKNFSTYATGITELETNSKPEFVVITNLLGQKLFQGNYTDAFVFAKGQGVVSIIPIDKDANVIGPDVKICVQ